MKSSAAERSEFDTRYFNDLLSASMKRGDFYGFDPGEEGLVRGILPDARVTVVNYDFAEISARAEEPR